MIGSHRPPTVVSRWRRGVGARVVLELQHTVKLRILHALKENTESYRVWYNTVCFEKNAPLIIQRSLD
jgi:hypothetical protein